MFLGSYILIKRFKTEGQPIFYAEYFNIAEVKIQEKKSPQSEIPNLAQTVLMTIYFHKTIKKLGVNRLVLRLGGTTLPIFHAEHINIIGRF